MVVVDVASTVDDYVSRVIRSNNIKYLIHCKCIIHRHNSSGVLAYNYAWRLPTGQEVTGTC